MGTRLLNDERLASVIPLRPRGFTTPVNADAPEPTQLYHLIVIAFVLHTPELFGSCVSCGQPWPCPQISLAFRLREGF